MISMTPHSVAKSPNGLDDMLEPCAAELPSLCARVFNGVGIHPGCGYITAKSILPTDAGLRSNCKYNILLEGTFVQ